MGIYYVEAFTEFTDCNLVALVDPRASRSKYLAQRFNVKHQFNDVKAMLARMVPDIVSVVTPTRFTPENVIACARAGVKIISAEKPIAASLKDADAMIQACQENHVVFAGGRLFRAMPEVQQAARLIRQGRIGAVKGACMWLGNELSGNAVQPISIVRLFAGAEGSSGIGWIDPPEVAEGESDTCHALGVLQFENGLCCNVFGDSPSYRSVEIWGSEGMVRFNWDAPELYIGTDQNGRWIQVDPQYTQEDYPQGYFAAGLRGMIRRVETGSEMPISGFDLCMALEIAIALKESSKRGHTPVALPLADRGLRLLPVPFRWDGGDATGGHYPDASGRLLPGWPYQTNSE